MSHLAAETDFGLDLLKQTINDVSVVLSPLSISLALSLVHAGANGSTKDQIRDAILKGASHEELISHYKEIGHGILKQNHEDVKVLVANRVFIRNGFKVKDSYLDEVKENYAAKAELLNFENASECTKHVNEFVKDITNGKISEIVNESTFKDSVALLVNAIYFDAKWQSPFYSSFTYNGIFHIKDGVTKEVQYMTDSEVRRLYAETDEAQILTLKYTDDAYAFSIILPKERFGLAKLKANLTGEKLQSMLADVKTTYLNIKIPKFKIEKELQLNDLLNALGIKQMFDSAHADLTGIAEELYVSEATHKAVIEVDEWGTVAAAATAFKMVPMSLVLDEPIQFSAEYPYLFVITYKKNVLFVGQMA